MRFLVKASWDIAAGNKLAKKGRLGSTVDKIIKELKPEAAYFLADHGERTAYLVVDLKDASQIPAVAEPFFLAFEASIEFQPVMVLADLKKAGPAIAKAVKKYA